MMMLKVVLISIAILNSRFSLGSDVLELLKEKNHFAMIRHAKAPGTGDPTNFELGDCKTQRNLSEEGIEQAKAIGKVLNSKLGKDFWIYTSEWCRCKDTAKHLGGKVPIVLPILNSFFENRGDGKAQTKELRTWLKENLSKYSPLILVTHQVNITELTDIFPSEGEILVLKLDADGSIKRIQKEK